MPHKNTVSGTAMLTAHALMSQIVRARNMFDEIFDRTTTSYNAMIMAYAKNVSDVAMITGFVRRRMFGKAEELYADMPVKWRDPVCSHAKPFKVFKAKVETNLISWSSMVDGYCKKGRVKNVITWTTMIDGYVKEGSFKDGFGLFSSMRRGVVAVNSITLTVIEGVQIYGLVSRVGFNFDIFLGNSIITIYCRFGLVDEANKTIWMMNKKNLVSWNSLISGYVHNDEIEKAYRLFEIMPLKNLVYWTTMNAGFSNKGNIQKSVQFRMMPEKDEFSWTAIISGFINNKQFEEAFDTILCYSQVYEIDTKIRQNQLTLSSVLSASAGLATLNQGAQIHALILKMGMEFNLYVQNSLVSMYSKCGNCDIFTNISVPNIISFNSMITRFLQNEFGEAALNLFRRMKNVGQKPNHITFLGVLSACTNAGLLYMIFNLSPTTIHACMIDLLGRFESLDEAIDLIPSMPFKSHARLAAQHRSELEPDNAAPYVVLSNLYSIVGKKMDADQVRMTKKLKQARKSPGCSWIDNVHLFLAGEQSHTDLNDIRVTLSRISKEMKDFSHHREDWLSFDQTSYIS
ncbi:hypothetical protein ACOSQ2_014413 [Xanthoceras sorbifolium]